MEVYEGKYDEKSDYWSLGCVLFECKTGEQLVQNVVNGIVTPSYIMQKNFTKDWVSRISLDDFGQGLTLKEILCELLSRKAEDRQIRVLSEYHDKGVKPVCKY